MKDILLPDLAAAQLVALPTFPVLPKTIDASLLLMASSRWQESSLGLQKLFADIPSTRDTLDRLIKQHLNLDGALVGLHFRPTGQTPERFVPLTDALVYVFEHPVLQTTLDQQCEVTGVDAAHVLFSLSATQLLERLKALNPAQAIEEGWNAHWDARAPGTPISRREHASQLYLQHFEATAQVAFAQRALTAEQLKPLLALTESSASHSIPQNPLARIEQVALLLSNDSKVKLSGAWLISIGDEAAGLLLYLPIRPVPVKAFRARGDLESWLSAQGLVPAGLPSDALRYEYTVRAMPLTSGISDLLSHHLLAQTSTLRNGHSANSGLSSESALPLAHADRMDQQRRISAVLSSAPAHENGLSAAEDPDEPSLFGSLYADIPRTKRQTALAIERNALELSGAEEHDSAILQSCKAWLTSQENAEVAANTAASALLYRARVLDTITFNREFTALHHAHKTGLQAEAEVQTALGRLSDDERNLLNALLEEPRAPGADTIAASLTLSMTERDGEQIKVTHQELSGPIVLIRAQSLLDASSPHSVLLYWPGAGGGLQRFANRAELERRVFKLHDQDTVLAVQLKKINGDPLQYSLNQLTRDFETQAGTLRQHHSEPNLHAQRDDKLEVLRQRALSTLQVPVHAARTLAVSHQVEQDRSATLVSHLPNWLKNLPVDARAGLKILIKDYLTAMHRSHTLLTATLIPRDDFTRAHLYARLRADFSVKDFFDVQIDLPDSVTWSRDIVSGGGTPGTPIKTLPIASAARSKMSLEQLAQLNIDNTPSMQLEPFALRLGFMRVEITTANEPELAILKQGITLPYLSRILPDLDLPKAYEQLIRDAFTGAPRDSAFQKEHRLECLLEPWRLMLKLQGECASQQKQIRETDLQILNIAIDANTAQAWQPSGSRIVILPAYLSVGGADTPNSGPVTLSGVTFIEEQISGTTLLYLPDSPDGQFLRRYNTLEEARKGLYNLCLRNEMVSYLAGKALHGSTRNHESRINQAVLNHFDALIGVGVRWPATTSLSDHLLNAHMGRLIEAHRGTSRANDALYFERYALQGPRAFNYLKMAMGIVPFVGSAFALYDAWTAANRAAAAFLRGEAAQGLQEVESVLLSLIDAAMDVLPGEVATSALSRTARSLTRARQFRALTTRASAFQLPSMREARRVVARFGGYEYDQPLSLMGLHPATQGLYRNVYRHADGDFIVRQGRIFKVELSKDSRNWRLSGTRQKTYKQPIALDEADQWDTWFGVHGTTFEGGGLGGGATLGHLADALDPMWPQAIRQRLPRWWADRTARRHYQLTQGIDDLSDRLEARLKQTNATLQTYNDNPAHLRTPLIPATDAALLGDIEMTLRQYQMLTDLLPLSHGNKRRVLAELLTRDAWLLADRYKHRCYLANARAHLQVHRIDALTTQLNAMTDTTFKQGISLVDDLRKIRVSFIRELDEVETLVGDLNYWYQRITSSSQKANITPEVTLLNGRFSETNLLYLKTGNLLEVVKRFDSASDVSWFYFQQQSRTLRANVDRALFTQFGLPEVTTTRAQRNQILQDCLIYYAQFRREMNIWTLRYPQHFHAEFVASLMAGIEKMAERARKSIELPAPARVAGQSNKKVFITEDDQLLIGIEQWETTTQQRQYNVTGPGGHKEIWEQGLNGKFRLLNPPATPATPVGHDLSSLLTDARKRLDAQAAYQTRVLSYAEQDMLGVDLEHMMVSEADELIHRARLIGEIVPQNPIVGTLRSKAEELIVFARALRTRQSLASKKPTDGMLDDLLTQDAAQIRKSSTVQNLGKRKDGRTDFMQEYEIWDTTQTPARVLWYAHFHYSSATADFRHFEKAHLKLPRHRFLTHADDASLPYADIGKRSVVLTHFESL